MKFIDLTESGSNIKKTVMIDKIKSFESLTYTTGQVVTIITFIDGTEIHVLQSINTVKGLIS